VSLYAPYREYGTTREGQSLARVHTPSPPGASPGPATKDAPSNVEAPHPSGTKEGRSPRGTLSEARGADGIVWQELGPLARTGIGGDAGPQNREE
jgi:hypothetical protein